MGVRTIALQERAEELGYETIQEAIDAGYYVGYRANGDHYLYKPDEQELAHEAWLKEKGKMLSILKGVQGDIAEWSDNKDHPDIKGLEEVITFMEDYCHD